MIKTKVAFLEGRLFFQPIRAFWRYTGYWTASFAILQLSDAIYLF